VFSTPFLDITNLKARMTDAFVTITEDMLENTWREKYPDGSLFFITCVGTVSTQFTRTIYAQWQD